MFRLLESDTSLMLLAGEARLEEQPHRFTRCWLLQGCMASGMVETRDFYPLNMGMPASRRLQRFSRTSVGETAKGLPFLAFPKFL